MYRLSLWFFRLYLLFFRKRGEIYGRYRIPSVGPMIVLANHISESDPWRIADLFRSNQYIRWWAKKGLFSVQSMFDEHRQRGSGYILSFLLAVGTVIVVRYSKTIPVDRDNPKAALNQAAIKKSIQILKQGGIVGIFPEGGVVDNGGAGIIGSRTCVAPKLALQCNADIVTIKLSPGRITVLRSFEPVVIKHFRQPPEELAKNLMRYIYLSRHMKA